MSVFIEHRQRDQDEDGNSLLYRPLSRSTLTLSSDDPDVAWDSLLSNTGLMRPGPQCPVPQETPPLLCAADTTHCILNHNLAQGTVVTVVPGAVCLHQGKSDFPLTREAAFILVWI